MTFLAMSAAFQACNAQDIRSPRSILYKDETKSSNIWQIFPGPWLSLFIWSSEKMVSNFASSGLLIWSLNHSVTSFIVSHKLWIEPCISWDRQEFVCSATPPFFFFFPKGRIDQTQDWIIKLCQDKGSVTNCTNIGRSPPGEVTRRPVDLTFSRIYFFSKNLTRCQVLGLDVSSFENPISQELGF